MGHITLVLLQFRIPFPIVYSIQEILLSLYTLSYRLNCRKNKNYKKTMRDFKNNRIFYDVTFNKLKVTQGDNEFCDALKKKNQINANLKQRLISRPFFKRQL